MRLLLIATAVAAVLIGVVWFGGLLGLHLGSTAKLIATLILVVAWLAVVIVVLIKRSRRGSSAAAIPPATKSFVRNTPGVAEMNDQFQKSYMALKSTRPAALGMLPWYLVIGAPGAGKSSLLKESGLTFASFGAGSGRGGGFTRTCDWWFTEEAVFLDTAGRYTSDNMTQTEWLAFLDLIRQARPELALNGVVVTVSVPDLIKKDDAGINAAAQQIRDRLNDLSRLLKLDVPLYIAFTKCDMIGGCKDFFAALPRHEREQVWGHTMPWQPQMTSDIRALFQRETANLLPHLRTRRIQALGRELTSDQQYKVIQFPHQFATVQKWMGDFLAALLRPSQQQTVPSLRGFYFTSAQQAQRPAAATSSATPAAPAVTAPAKSVDLEASVFLQANAPQLSAPSDEQCQGLFIKDLLTKVVIGDQRLVQVSPAVRRQRAIVRIGALVASTAALVVLGIALTSWFLGGRTMIAETITASQQVIDTARSEPTKLTANLAALDHLRAALAKLDRHSSGGAQHAREQAYQLYYTQLKRYFLTPVGNRLRGELEALRTSQDKTLTTYDTLDDLSRTYRMLSGDGSSRELLERVLGANRRWLVGVDDASAPLDPAIEAAAQAQLAHFVSHFDNSDGWKIPIDQPLMERLNFELGETLLIPKSYEDIVTTLQSGSTKVGRDQVLPGANREQVAADYDFPVIFSQRGWDDTMAGAITEKSESLHRKYQGLKIDKPTDIIRERLRTRFAADVTRHWLRLLTGVRPAHATDLREAAANLRTLTGPQSAYRDLIRSVWQGMAVRYNATDLAPVGGDSEFKWVEDALTALAEFQATVDTFATATDPGRRANDVARLLALQASYEAAWAKVGTVLKAVESAERRAAATQAFENLTFEIHRVLSAEVTAELDQRWNERVAKLFAAELAGRFPFDRTAKNDATLAVFSRMFNPKNGLATVAATEIETLRRLKFAGRDLLPVNRDYERLTERARDIRAALYGEEATITCPFTLTLMQREGVKDVRVVVGGEAFGLYDRPDKRGKFIWKENGDTGAKLSVNVVGDQWLTRDLTASPWGLIRLLRDGQPIIRAEGGQTCTWQFAGTGVGKDVTFNASAVLEANGLERLIPADFFGTLVCPERVGR